jgi:hypothetical protein
MITIPVQVCGDSWVNPDEVNTLLKNSDITQYVVLDFKAEGPSMSALGIFACVSNHCRESGRDSSTINITNISNQFEEFPYKRENLHRRSHFFNLSKIYWREELLINTHEFKFGFFMGRRTISRAKILYDLWHTTQYKVLLSCMKTPGPLPWMVNNNIINIENLNDWVSNIDEFQNWWQQCPVASLDNHSVQDQYIVNPTTNQDILDHYHRFDIELVAESYTLGNTFFPTEKTVRPIMAVKPFIVYGPKLFLKRLRDMGFKTYSEFWEEDYDYLEGPARWQRIKELLPNVQYSSEVELVAKYNRLHLAELIKK